MKSLYDTLQDSLIIEMAADLERFSNIIANQTSQIIENWCLVWYCDNYDEDNLNRNHWASEFLAAAKPIITTKIKVRNRKKIIERVIVKDYEYDNKLNIIESIQPKMKKEHLDKYIGYMTDALKENLKEIIDILSSNYNDAQNYIQYPIGY